MRHAMILFDADLKAVLARLSKKYKASEAQMVERDSRKVEDGVRFSAEAPEPQTQDAASNRQEV